MRRIAAFLVLAAAVAGTALAQTQSPPPPPMPADPPGLTTIDSVIEPQVTIRAREGELVEEHRVNGKLYKVIVRPENAPPYTLVDPNGDGNFIRHDGPGDKPVVLPMWVIHTF